MRLRFATTALLLQGLCIAPVAAQLQALRLDGERRATTVVFVEQKAIGLVSVQYGQPPWKVEYEKLLADDRPQRFRLGKDFWTHWSSSVDVSMQGVRIPAGDWYLGLAREKGGRLGLAFLDPDEVRKARAFPLSPHTYPVTFSVPLAHSKDPDIRHRLRITLLPDRDEPEELTLEIAWGPHRLTARGRAELE